jgi:signal transduction histidine kinase
VVAEVEEGTMALADPTPLYQVLGHLLDNAIKYSPEGGTITIRVVPTPHDVRIDVIDEGVGLPDGVDIFEPFRRGEPREDDEPPGVGLGLHIVRSLLEAMDGSVDARTNEDGGSTFTVRLPKA